MSRSARSVVGGLVVLVVLLVVGVFLTARRVSDLEHSQDQLTPLVSRTATTAPTTAARAPSGYTGYLNSRDDVSRCLHDVVRFGVDSFNGPSCSILGVG